MTDAPQVPPHEPFQFSSRLLFTYCAAAISFVATGDSIWITLVAAIARVVMVWKMVWRFRGRAMWALIGAPAALYWLWLIVRPPLVPAVQVV